jgi:acyl-CoA hydrolase
MRLVLRRQDDCLDLPAFCAYIACMQYTLRNIPKVLDAALRRRARTEQKSLNEVAIQAMAKALHVSDTSVRYRKLNDIAGTWREDPEFDAAIDEQQKIEEKLWK